MKIARNADGTYTVTPEGDEGDVIAWAIREHDRGILVAVLDSWLRGERDYRGSRSGAIAVEKIRAAPQKADLKEAIAPLIEEAPL